MENNKKLEEQVEELFMLNSHKTTKQKIRLLKLNKNFQKDIFDLRVKHKKIIKEFLFNSKELIKELVNNLFDRNLVSQLKNAKDVKMAWEPMSVAMKKKPKQKIKNRCNNIATRILKTSEDKLFNEDIIAICNKYKLYPIENWCLPIISYSAFNHIPPSDLLLGKELEGYLPREEIIKLPQNMNFSPKIIINKITGEKELYIKLFDNTTLKSDLKKNWHIIEKLQKTLRNEKGIKRYYALKNLPIMEKLSGKNNKIYDPVLDREIKKTDIDIALETYQDIPFNKKEEKKAGNRIKQIRHQQKKRLS